MSSTSPNFKRIEVAPAYQKVADAIEREIVNGRIKPDDPIGTESELVQQFGVNRSTVREGIRVLEESGLIRRDSSRRLYACLPRYNKLASRLSRALVLHEVTFRELYETAMILEVAAIEYAVDHATDEDIAEVALNIEKTEQAIANPAAFAELDAEFHILIAKASHNRVLQLAREPAGLLFFPTTEMVVRNVAEGMPRLIAAHHHLLDAIRKRDKQEGMIWMRRHVEDWRRGFERAGNSLDRPVERMYMEHALMAQQKR